MSANVSGPADLVRHRNSMSPLRKAGLQPVASEMTDDRKAAPMIDLIDPWEVDALGELPLERYFTKAYFMGHGKQSWHSSWTNLYVPGSVSFDLQQLKRNAEDLRAQGSVFRIESIPMMVLRYGRGAFGVAPINEKSESEYGALAADMEVYGPRGFWKSLPSRSSNWLLAFSLNAPSPAAEEYSPLIFKAMSGGTPHPLAWHQLKGGGYCQFFQFAEAFLAQLPKPAQEGAARKVHAVGLRVA